MRSVALIQIVAALVPTVFFALIGFIPGSLVAFMYLLIAIGTLAGVRVCLAICPLMPLGAVALLGPVVLYNFYLYFSDDPLYLDSPGTVLVVVIPAVFVLLPAVVVLALLVRNWRSYVQVVRGAAA